MRYARSTTVSTDRSRSEIERTLARYGAEQFAYASAATKAMVIFKMNQRTIRFEMPIPALADFMRSEGGRDRTEVQASQHAEQAARQRWRALLLAIKAKLEAVESGIASFEDEFLAYFVMANGQTVGQTLVPQLDQATKLKGEGMLLLGHSKKGGT